MSEKRLNAAEVVKSLDAEAIRDRIDELERERAALLILLRAAQRMERDKKPKRIPAPKAEQSPGV